MLENRVFNDEYDNLSAKQLKSKCKENGIKGYSSLSKDQLIKKLRDYDTKTTTMDKIKKAFQ